MEKKEKEEKKDKEKEKKDKEKKDRDMEKKGKKEKDKDVEIRELRKEGEGVGEEKEGKKIKALVTGACGFVGSHMVDVLIEKGYDVYATDLPTVSRRYLNSEAKFIPSDLTKPDTLENLPKVDVIFHPAAVFNYSAPFEVLKRVNVDGTKNLIEKVKAKKMVMWSTAGVYDVSRIKEPIDELGPLGPSNNYELSKLWQEVVAFEYYRKGYIDLIVLRPAPIYGPRNFYGVANYVFGLAELRLPILVLPRIKNRSVSVHVKDVCYSAEYLWDKFSGEVFNLVDDSKYSYSEVLKIVGEAIGKKIYEIPVEIPATPISYVSEFAAKMLRIFKENHKIYDIITSSIKILKYLEEDTARYMRHSYMFSNKKLKESGYKLLYPDFKDGIKETIDWYRKEGLI